MTAGAASLQTAARRFQVGMHVDRAWRDHPEVTAAHFDDEGFYLLGDALRPADPEDLSKGFFFDGRVAENFKLATGTWVAVGALRAAMIDHFGGLISDAVIVGENAVHLSAIVVPAERATPEALRERLESFAAAATGGSFMVRFASGATGAASLAQKGSRPRM